MHGNVLRGYSYKPYGEETKGQSDDNSFKFVGSYGVRMDGSSGLHYMVNRYYDSSNGRFLSVDPVRSQLCRSFLKSISVGVGLGVGGFSCDCTVKDFKEWLDELFF